MATAFERMVIFKRQLEEKEGRTLGMMEFTVHKETKEFRKNENRIRAEEKERALKEEKVPIPENAITSASTIPDHKIKYMVAVLPRFDRHYYSVEYRDFRNPDGTTGDSRGKNLPGDVYETNAHMELVQNELQSIVNKWIENRKYLPVPTFKMYSVPGGDVSPSNPPAMTNTWYDYDYFEVEVSCANLFQ